MAQRGVVISIPGFFRIVRIDFEAINFRRVVVTDVKKDRDSAVEVVEQCYVGDDLGGAEMTWESMELSVLGNGSDATRGAQRSVNVHTLLDNTGSCESQPYH